ncbi:MAG: phosphoglycerate mutase family protein [Wenzhouxiangellaceae bacterium]|nr:phosphoglycerate mutase family protein [Wenzhouxiangellaceae bacterium]
MRTILARRCIKAAIGTNAALLLIAFSVLAPAPGAIAEAGIQADRTASKTTTVIVVRHAEKIDDSRDPALSTAGRERAQALAEAVEHAGLDAAYASQYQRTRLTAMPTAAQAGLTVRTEAIDAEIDSWARAFAVELVRRHPEQSVLVVGHSNTVPALVSALCRCEVEPLTEADYDRLFIVNRAGGDDPALIVARFGAE